MGGKSNEGPAFLEWKDPSPALLRSVPDGTVLRRAPSPPGEGCHFWYPVKLGKPPSPLGGSRCQRFYQPERDG